MNPDLDATTLEVRDNGLMLVNDRELKPAEVDRFGGWVWLQDADGLKRWNMFRLAAQWHFRDPDKTVPRNGDWNDRRLANMAHQEKGNELKTRLDSLRPIKKPLAEIWRLYTKQAPMRVLEQEGTSKAQMRAWVSSLSIRREAARMCGLSIDEFLVWVNEEIDDDIARGVL